MRSLFLFFFTLTLGLPQLSCVRTTTSAQDDLLIRAQEEIQNIP